jgi:hypothetical protein
MTFMKFYFREEEAAWIRAQGKGFVRKVIINEMHRYKVHEKVTETFNADYEVKGKMPPPEAVQRVVRGPTCRECGGLTLAGRCLVCGRLQ